MMRKFVLTFCIGCTLAMPATAAPTIQEIISQLEAQGYRDVTVSRTWLGRVRIEAESSTHEREIVFNQRTGEILRDFWEELEDEEEEEGEGEDPEVADEDDASDAAEDEAEDTESDADEEEGDEDDGDADDEDEDDDDGNDEEGDEDEDDS